MEFKEKTLNSEIKFDGKVVKVLKDDIETADSTRRNQLRRE